MIDNVGQNFYFQNVRPPTLMCFLRIIFRILMMCFDIAIEESHVMMIMIEPVHQSHYIMLQATSLLLCIISSCNTYSISMKFSLCSMKILLNMGSKILFYQEAFGKLQQ